MTHTTVIEKTAESGMFAESHLVCPVVTRRRSLKTKMLSSVEYDDG